MALTVGDIDSQRMTLRVLGLEAAGHPQSCGWPGRTGPAHSPGLRRADRSETMDLNALLEIVISLAALFWLLSMGCSFVIEAINSLVRNVRADALERFVCEMILGDGKVQAVYEAWKGRLSTNPAADPLGVLSHGLTESLRKPSKSAGDATTPPSYIPAEVFAKVLLDRLTTLAAAAGQGLGDCGQLLDELVGPASPLDPAWRARIGPVATGAARAQGLVGACTEVLKSLMSSPLPVAINDLSKLRAQLAGAVGLSNAAAVAHLLRAITQLEQALTALDDPTKPNQTLTDLFGSPETAWMRLLGAIGANAAGMDVVDAVRAVVEHGHLPRALSDALRPIIANANFDLAQVRKGIEDWYNSVMERATGWFKRNTTLLLFYLGMLVAVVANINPFLIWQDLTKDPALRGAGVAFANQVIEQQGDSILAQRLLFSREAKMRDWDNGIKHVADAASAARTASSSSAGETASAASPAASSAEAYRKSVDEIAHQIQPLLLRSGNFAGLLPQVRTPADGNLDPSERKQFLEATCNAWHEAQISAGRVKKDDKPFAGLLSCPGLGEHFAYQGDLSETTVAKTTVEPAVAAPPASGASAISTTTVERRSRREARGLQSEAKNANAGKFWSSADIVWDTRLTTALWKAQVAAYDPAEADTKTINKELLEAFTATREQADEAAKRLASFLDRLPSVGWKWDTAVSCGKNLWDQRWKLLLGLLGWPLTGLMVSFGAAFWFDLLSKLMNRRVTGPRPDGVS
jgi:hypothetical protein